LRVFASRSATDETSVLAARLREALCQEPFLTEPEATAGVKTCRTTRRFEFERALSVRL